MRIIKSHRHYPIPHLDLPTFLFDSEYSASLEDTPLHISAPNPSIFLTKSSLRTYSQRIAFSLRKYYSIGSNGPNTDIVTIFSSGQVFSPAIFFGIIGASGVVSSASHSFTARELARQIESGGSGLLICSEDLIDVTREAARLTGLSGQNVLVFKEGAPWSLKSLDGTADLLPGGDEGRILPFPKITNEKELRESVIVLLWSSGTMGKPKGVMLSHWNLVSQLWLPTAQAREWAKPFVERGDEMPVIRSVAHLPIAHIAGTVGYLTGPLLMGGVVYWMRKFEWKKYLEYSKTYKVTSVFTVPTIWLRIAKSPDVTDQFKYALGGGSGASSMDGELQRAANSKLGDGKSAFINQTWGMSETAGAVTFMPRGEQDNTGSISPILANMELRFVDEDYNDVEPGQPGELIVRGDLVTRGYWKDEKATREAFRDGWFCSGDVAVERDGKFYIVDRRKEIFKYKGLQIAPAEIEGLLDTHPLIAEAAVVGVPVGKPGEGEVPRAYVVADPTKISEDEIKKLVADKLAYYKQLRGGVAFVRDLPKSAIGKVLRRDLRELARKEMKTSKL